MKKPILVTGSHRSGSTWIGKMISESPEVGYVREPFNLWISWYNQPFKHQLEYISNACPEEHRNKAIRYIHSFMGFPNGMAWARIFGCRSMADFYFTFRDLAAIRRRFFQRILFKDPIAVFSAEWFHAQFNSDVIVVIRHPAAFVASLKVKNWTYDFNHLFDQKELMKSHLKDYYDEIKFHAEHPQDIVEQGILFWNIHYNTILTYQEKYKGSWMFIRHEDVSLNPISEFQKVFDFLNLEMTEGVKEAIERSTNATEESKHERNSAENVQTWKKRLTPEEIVRVKQGTESTWKKYYSEDDWN